MFPIITPASRVAALLVAAVMTVTAFATAPGAMAATPSAVQSSGDVAETPAGDPPAQFPEDAYEAGRTGYAMVDCIVGENGKTSNCAVLKTHGSLRFGDAALDFARSETFRPATHNGVPVAKHHQWKLIFLAN